MDLETAETLVFPSMVFSGDRNQLVSVKAVDPFYPLRGELIAGDQPFQRFCRSNRPKTRIRLARC